MSPDAVNACLLAVNLIAMVAAIWLIIYAYDKEMADGKTSRTVFIALSVFPVINLGLILAFGIIVKVNLDLIKEGEELDIRLEKQLHKSKEKSTQIKTKARKPSANKVNVVEAYFKDVKD